MKAGLCPLLLMETVICDSKLSQLSFSTTSAHSSNAQPSSKRKSPPFWRKKKGQSPEKFCGSEVGSGGYSAKLFSTSRIEVFFSSEVLAHRRCALQRVVCRWGCLHTQMQTTLCSTGRSPNTYEVFFYYYLILKTNVRK